MFEKTTIVNARHGGPGPRLWAAWLCLFLAATMLWGGPGSAAPSDLSAVRAVVSLLGTQVDDPSDSADDDAQMVALLPSDMPTGDLDSWGPDDDDHADLALVASLPVLDLSRPRFTSPEFSAGSFRSHAFGRHSPTGPPSV